MVTAYVAILRLFFQDQPHLICNILLRTRLANNGTIWQTKAWFVITVIPVIRLLWLRLKTGMTVLALAKLALKKLKTAENAANHNGNTRCEQILLILRVKYSYFLIFIVANRPYFVPHSIPNSQQFLSWLNTESHNAWRFHELIVYWPWNARILVASLITYKSVLGSSQLQSVLITTVWFPNSPKTNQNLQAGSVARSNDWSCWPKSKNFIQ